MSLSMNSNHIPDLSQTNTGQPPESVAEPPSIEGYRIKELLGQGGMGVVWRAEQIRPQRDVALKLMRSDVLRRIRLELDFRWKWKWLPPWSIPVLPGCISAIWINRHITLLWN